MGWQFGNETLYENIENNTTKLNRKHLLYAVDRYNSIKNNIYSTNQTYPVEHPDDPPVLPTEKSKNYSDDDYSQVCKNISKEAFLTPVSEDEQIEYIYEFQIDADDQLGENSTSVENDDDFSLK